MKPINGRISPLRRLGMTFFYTALFTMSFSAAANVAQAPLSMTEGVSPNMILTLDESGSMSWGHVPDNQPWDGDSWSYDSRRYRAANTNPMSYNPHVIYEIPPAFDSSGNEITLATSFTDAPVNGFLPDGTQGKVDLTSNYRVVREFRMPDGTFSRADHPSDWRCSRGGFSSNNTKQSCDNGQIRFDITRTSSNRCTAVAFLGGKQIDIAGGTGTPGCSINSDTATARLSLTAGVPAYYYEFDATLDNGNCAGKKINSDGGGESCYRLRWVDATSAYDENGNRLRKADNSVVDGRENFAIWYSFYKTRALATLSAASMAFYNLRSDVRLTWQNLATCSFKELSSSERNSLSSCSTRGLQAYSKAHKGAFYTWLRSIYFNTGTPTPNAMKRAGELLKKSEPWQNNPGGSGNTTQNTYECRPSYHIMMTDGMWNENVSSNPSSFRHDNSNFTVDGKSYSQIKPYHDTSSNTTLADLAMHYWATDLKTDLANKVPPHIPFRNLDNPNAEFWDPRNNPATWQHMTNFIMGLGLSNALNKSDIPWEGATHKGRGYANLLNGTASWPQTATSGSNFNNNVYDLWHAAINSRGEFFSVDSPEAMIQAFQDILTRIADRKSTATRPAVNSSTEDDGTGTKFVRYFYQTSFASDENWAGDLKRIKSERGSDSTDQTTVLWSAQNLLNSKTPVSRNIKIASSSGDSRLKNFTWDQIKADANTSGALAYLLRINPEDGVLGDASDAQGRLNFLRGARTGEGTTYRQRVHVLGDLYSSSPAVVSGPRYLESFGNRLEGNSAYTTFIDTISARNSSNNVSPRPARVYVGGNDGMLHAFDANTGEETFAFIPSAVFPKLNKLTGKNYSHEFYVDGSPVVADVYFGSAWRTILIGTFRAGGKGLFALDITTPGAEKLLWEFTESSVPGANKVKPGYSFPKPTVARLHNGKWAVVVGNGYEGGNTEDGKAALYIIDAETGALTKSLEVQGATGIKNGLSTPRLADYNGDGIADYAYAGDLQGNLWRFNLLGAGASPTRTNGNIYGNDHSNTDGFTVSYAGSPLFRATSTQGAAKQPITAAPSIIRHPSREGYLIIFGTGKYFETTDKDGVKTHAQSLYGIWDRKTKAESTTAITISRSDLVAQQISQAVTAIAEDGSSRIARTVTNNPIQWLTDAGQVNKYGWWLDLRVGSSPLDGEMMIEDMSALGQTIFFQTLVPNDDPCSSGASNWTYAINPFTGGRTSHHAFDYKTQGGDVISGVTQSGEGGFSISSDNDGGYDLNTGNESINIYPDPTSIGRQSWRIVGRE